VNGQSVEINGQSYDPFLNRFVPEAGFRPEGFSGQHRVVLPESVLLQMQRDPLLRAGFPTATGYFPEAPGHLVERPHGVGELIVIVCLSGEGWVRFGNRKPIAVRANEALFIPPWTPHSYGADAAQPWSIMWVQCRGNDIPLFLELLGVTLAAPLICMPEGGFDRIGFAELYQLLEQGYTEANLLSSATHLRFILAEISRLRLPEHPGARSTEEVVARTMNWMSRNLDRPATLADLAQMAGLSVSHFCAVFRRKTGFAPMDYFLRAKIQRACQLLDTTELRIEAVAAAIGAEDPYYFSRFFKKVIGLSPRAYRKIPKG
jgi:AraC-like DNA-binding protein